MPPPRPSASAQTIQDFYQANTNGIRAGLVLTMIGGTLTAPWVAAISTQLKRIEGRYSPLSYTQLGLGMLGVLLNDLAWIPFVGVWTCAAVQNVAIGIAVFHDKAQKVFPRWVGYFNIWTAVLFCPGSLLYFFKDGPFAWNGALSWWLVVVVFCAWFVVMFFAMRRAIHSHALEEQQTSEPLLR